MSSGISPVFTLAEGENYYGYSNATEETVLNLENL